MEFVDDFLVEPRTEAREEIAFERVSKEALAFQDLVGVALQMLHVLLGEDSADDLLVNGALLFVRFPVLQLPSVILLLQPRLICLKFLRLSQPSMSSLLVLILFLLFLHQILLLIKLHSAGLDDLAEQRL